MTTPAATLARAHVWRPGRAAQSEPSQSDAGPSPLLLLHGTGADENDLLPLADRLAPASPVLSPRGAVLENGTVTRHFRRFSEREFDEVDIAERVDELAEFVRAAEQAHEVPPGRWVAVGFSNGASTATALLLRHPEMLAGAVLFAGMPPFVEPPAVDLSGRWVIIANGVRDPLATPALTAVLDRQLSDRGAQVTVLSHPGGHTIDGRQLAVIAADLREHA